MTPALAVALGTPVDRKYSSPGTDGQRKRAHWQNRKKTRNKKRDGKLHGERKEEGGRKLFTVSTDGRKSKTGEMEEVRRHQMCVQTRHLDFAWTFPLKYPQRPIHGKWRDYLRPAACVQDSSEWISSHFNSNQILSAWYSLLLRNGDSLVRM